MAAKLKVYCMNLDGTHRAVVAAPSKQEAARLFGTTLGEVNRYGCVTSNPDAVGLAMTEVGKVWYQKMEYGLNADLTWYAERPRRTP